MMQRASTVAIVGLALATVAHARPIYPARLPNGANVPNVPALGHVDVQGGGPNNDFGLDFAAADHQWTADFCAADSDGDGQTNGQELGDPCCEFVVGSNAVVRWTEGISHPGDASETSDPSLWANITCGGAGSGSVRSAAGSSSAAAGSSSATASSSSAAVPSPAAAPSSAADSSSSSSSGSTPTPTPTSAASAAGVSAVAAAAVAVAAAAFA